MINMSIDSFPIPAIFISQADGQAMVAAAKDGVGTLTVSNSTYDAPSETGRPALLVLVLGLDVLSSRSRRTSWLPAATSILPATTIPMV